MTINIEELRRLAQAATPGPWKMVPVGDGRQKFAVADSEFLSILTVMDEGGATFGTVYDDDDARFIAAANPAAIFELLDRLEAAEKERDALRSKIAEMGRQEPVAWLHETRRDSDVVTDAVKHVWGKAVVGALAAYSIPLYLAPGAKGEEK